MTQHDGNGFWLGVDLSQASVDVATAAVGMNPMDWKEWPQKHFDNDSKGLAAMVDWTDRQMGGTGRLEGVCVESTGRLSQRFVEALAALKTAWPTASIVNPKRPRDFGKSLGVREKTDPIDARILAVYGAVNRPAPTPPVPEGYRRLRELSRSRQVLVRHRTALGNSLRDQEDPIARKLLERAAKDLDKAIKQSQEKAWRLIREDADLRRDYELLKSIKGIADIVAWTLLAELGDLRAYGRNQLVARVGVYPGRWESGTSVHRRPRWVKGGCAPVRKVLFNAARAILNSKNNTLRAYADRLAGQGWEPMACIAALMRKLLLVARTIVIQEVPYDPNHA